MNGLWSIKITYCLSWWGGTGLRGRSYDDISAGESSEANLIIALDHGRVAWGFCFLQRRSAVRLHVRQRTLRGPGAAAFYWAEWNVNVLGGFVFTVHNCFEWLLVMEVQWLTSLGFYCSYAPWSVNRRRDSADHHTVPPSHCLIVFAHGYLWLQDIGCRGGDPIGCLSCEQLSLAHGNQLEIMLIMDIYGCYLCNR